MNAEQSMVETSSFETLWSEQQFSATSHFFRMRPRVVLPVACAACWIFSLGNLGRGQGIALCLVSAALAALTWWEARRGRKGAPSTPAQWTRCLSSTLLGLLLLCALSGGLKSPFAPLLLVPTVVTFAVFGRRRMSWIALAALMGGIVLLLAIARIVPGLASIPAAHQELLTALTLVGTLLLLMIEVVATVEAGRATAEELDHVRRQTAADADLRSRTLDAMGARVAHEIKNPLTAISGLAQLLAGEAQGAPAQRRLAVMLDEIQRMEAILHDYLTVSRPTSELQCSTVNLRQLADEVVAVLEGDARERGIQVCCVGPAIEARVEPGLIKQALLNLLKNALEATSHGGHVYVETKQQVREPVFEVHDDGCGMDSTKLACLGRAFFTDRENGTGLGVTLARTIARRHDGQLEYFSEPGRGTTARFSLSGARPAEVRQK